MSKKNKIITLLIVVLAIVVAWLCFTVSMANGRADSPKYENASTLLVFAFSFAWYGFLFAIPAIIVGLVCVSIGLFFINKHDIWNVKSGVKNIDKILNSINLSPILNVAQNKNIKTLSNNRDLPPPVKEILLDNSEQVEFLKEQKEKIRNYIIDRTNNSNLPQNHKIRELIAVQENSLEDIIKGINSNIFSIELDKYCYYQFVDSNNIEQVQAPLLVFCKTNSFPSTTESEFKSHMSKIHEFIECLNFDCGRVFKGTIGEERVSQHLSLYKDIIINLKNIRFEIENTTVEADNILVCEKGIFCIETKNYGNADDIIEISKDGRWKRWKNGYEIPINNISNQHNRHIGIMQRLINKELKKRGFNVGYIELEPIYVIANDKVTIENNSEDITVLRASSIQPFIKRYVTENKLSKDVQEAIVEIIMDYKQPLKKYPILDYSEPIKYHFDKLISDIESVYGYLELFNEYIKLIESNGYIVKVEYADYIRYITIR